MEDGESEGDITYSLNGCAFRERSLVKYIFHLVFLKMCYKASLRLYLQSYDK